MNATRLHVQPDLFPEAGWAHAVHAPYRTRSNSSRTLHQRYIYRGYLQVACCDLTRAAHPCLWLITWDPTQPTATRPLALQKDGTWYTYGWDLTKNICEVFGTDGLIKTSYNYTPYGAVTAEGSVTQPIQWSSEFCDDELGLVYYNYRHYNPMAGRWLGRDIIEEAFVPNLYIYCLNNSLLAIDYIGLTSSPSVRDATLRSEVSLEWWNDNGGIGGHICGRDNHEASATAFIDTRCECRDEQWELILGNFSPNPPMAKGAFTVTHQHESPDEYIYTFTSHISVENRREKYMRACVFGAVSGGVAAAATAASASSGGSAAPVVSTVSVSIISSLMGTMLEGETMTNSWSINVKLSCKKEEGKTNTFKIGNVEYMLPTAVWGIPHPKNIDRRITTSGGAGYELYVVGGTYRSYPLNKPNVKK